MATFFAQQCYRKVKAVEKVHAYIAWGRRLEARSHTHSGSIVHLGKSKQYCRNALLPPSVGLNPHP